MLCPQLAKADMRSADERLARTERKSQIKSSSRLKQPGHTVARIGGSKNTHVALIQRKEMMIVPSLKNVDHD